MRIQDLAEPLDQGFCLRAGNEIATQRWGALRGKLLGPSVE
jgi:hypothetical protein